MKKKIHFGKKTMKSLELQITSILTSLNRSEVRIDRIKPVRHDIGNFVFEQYENLRSKVQEQGRYVLLCHLNTPSRYPFFKSFNL